jgi:hypothetical protein
LGDGQLSGTITGYIICGFASAVIGVYANSGGSGTIDNVIIEEILYDQPDGTLQLFNHPTNQPRVEYDYQGNRLGLLVEEARTNLIPYSNTSAGWSRTTDITKTSNYSTGPDGLSSSIRLQKPSNSGVSSYFNAGLLISGGTANKTFTVSCWAKGTGKFQLKNTHGGVIDSFSSDIDATPNWTRYEFTVTNSSIAGNGLQYVGLSWNSTDSKASVVDIEIFGFQLEQGFFATSYIPTSGATATRSADIASVSVSEFGYNQAQGSVVVEYSTGIDGCVTSLDSGGNDRIYNGLEAGQIKVLVASGGIFQADLSTGPFTLSGTQTLKQAYAAAQNDFTGYINGTFQSSDTSGNMPNLATSLRLGVNEVNGAHINGHIKSINYYPLRLSDAKLQELTS